LDAQAVIERVTGALSDFQVGEHADDIAALTLRRKSPGSPAQPEQDVGGERRIEPVATSAKPSPA
ncbi:MAG: hypothetical protein ACRDL5_01450, partial [Solirubrobacteraceae bacterium]